MTNKKLTVKKQQLNMKIMADYRFNYMLHKFNYMLLGRLKSDCEYYLVNGGRNAKQSLWAHDEQKQIDKMREIYDSLKIKPKWLTIEQIDEYAARMGAK